MQVSEEYLQNNFLPTLRVGGKIDDNKAVITLDNPKGNFKKGNWLIEASLLERAGATYERRVFFIVGKGARLAVLPGLSGNNGAELLEFKNPTICSDFQIKNTGKSITVSFLVKKGLKAKLVSVEVFGSEKPGLPKKGYTLDWNRLRAGGWQSEISMRNQGRIQTKL